MQKVKVELEVSKEAHELAQGLVEMVKVVKEAMKDGFQVGQDLPAIITAAIAKLPPAIEGLDKLPEELKDPGAFAKAMVVAASDLVEVFVKKEELPPAA